MREIKFRAWITTEKKMVMVECVDFYFVPGKTNYDISFHANGEKHLRYRNDVHGAILLQFTGFRDKNGKEIWEGDILRHKEGKIGEVAWHTWYPCLTVYDETSEGVDLMEVWEDEEGNLEFEVIGNIYQDSHLIEKPNSNV